MSKLVFVIFVVFSHPIKAKVYDLKDNLPEIVDNKNLSIDIGVKGEIKIVNRGEQITIPLFKIHNPGLESKIYSVWGKIKYEGVKKASYLELWNVFNKRKYFTRTKAGSGFMKRISGDSEYRIFSLPFNRKQVNLKLSMLQLNLVLKGKGKVVFAPQIFLVNGVKNPFKKLKKKPEPNLPWWNNDTGGYIGGFFGLIIGLCGAISAFFIHKGKNYLLVKIFIGIVLVIALASLITGFTAYFCYQPYAVYYPMLLSGVISVFVFVLQAVIAKKRFESTMEEEE